MFFRFSFSKKTQQADGTCSDTNDTQLLCEIFKKCLFMTANTYEKYIVGIAHDADKLLFLPNCRYHIMLIGDIDELLQKVDAFCFAYQHVDWLYTFLKNRFGETVVARSGQVFDNVQRAIYFNQKTRQWTKFPAFQRRNEKYLLSSLRKTKSTQIKGSAIAERIELVKKTEIELELTKIVHCFFWRVR